VHPYKNQLLDSFPLSLEGARVTVSVSLGKEQQKGITLTVLQHFERREAEKDAEGKPKDFICRSSIVDSSITV